MELKIMRKRLTIFLSILVVCVEMYTCLRFRGAYSYSTLKSGNLYDKERQQNAKLAGVQTLLILFFLKKKMNYNAHLLYNNMN